MLPITRQSSRSVDELSDRAEDPAPATVTAAFDIDSPSATGGAIR